MTDTVKISCRIDTTDPACPLGLEIWLDNQLIFDCIHVNKPVYFTHEMLDSDDQHQLKFCLKGKLPQHTQIDELGNIIKDACIVIDNVSFDEIELGNLLIDSAVYTHDFNGTKPVTQDKFYGKLGCNGIVELQFSTPFYLWLLENM